MSTVDLTHYENNQRHLSRTNCWMLRPLDVGRSGFRCDTPGSYQTCYHLTPMFHHFHCPKPVRKSGFGTGTYVSAKLHSSLLTKEYLVRPRLNAVKCHITADYLQTILFIGIYVTAVGIISPERLLTLSHGKILTSKLSH